MSGQILKNNFQNKIFNFIKKNVKKLIVIFILLITILCIYFFYASLQKKSEIKLSEKYTQATIQFKQKK